MTCKMINKPVTELLDERYKPGQLRERLTRDF